MSVLIKADHVHLVDECTIDDVEILINALQFRPDVHVDVSAATHLHAAIVQILLVQKPMLTGTPLDTFLAAWLVPALKPALGTISRSIDEPPGRSDTGLQSTNIPH